MTKSDGTRNWLEHSYGGKVDIVAIPLSIDEEVEVVHLNLDMADVDLIVSPSEPVSIIGFPFGKASGGRFPIWKTGHIASDIDIDYNQLPAFLIDATTKAGMSGSPVIARRVGHYRSSTAPVMGGSIERFLGVYSGLITPDADVGVVWKPKAIREVLPQA